MFTQTTGDCRSWNYAMLGTQNTARTTDMVHRVQTWMIDDFDGESHATETVTFALDGVGYEIDLSSPNAGKLREVIRPWQQNGRRVGNQKRGATQRGKTAPAAPRIDPSQARAIREWAGANGYTVSPRGKIPAAVHEAFEAAHS
jgi:hypothetical protein